MNVVGLHPEELIDKLAAGELSGVERERLDAHLAQCSACRFEIGVRADLEQEIPVFEDRPQLTFPNPSERARPAAAAPRMAASIRPRSRRRWPLVMLAAALVLCAGGATAAVLTGAVQARWLPWVPEPKQVSATPAATSSKASSKPKRFAAKPAVSTEPQFDDGSAEQTVPSLPSASAEPVLAAAPVIAPVPPLAREAVRSKRVLAGAALVAPGSVRSSAGSAAPSTALSSAAPEAMNARVEAAPPRLDPAAALFADANRARRDGNADRAVALYRSLQSRYPSSSESELSRALLAQLLLDRGSPEAALAGFDRYLAADAPVLSAEALVGRARALEQLGKSAQAIAAWREIQTRFAGSVHARLAATRLAALGMR